MGIRPLLSSITRRPQEGPWRRTRLQKCRWNHFSIRPFRLANLGGDIAPVPILDCGSYPSRIGVVVTPFASMLQACARVLRPGQRPVHSSGAAWTLLPTRLRNRAWARFGASEVRPWPPEEQCSQITVAAPLICGREWCDRRSRFVSVPDRAMPQSRGLYRKHHLPVRHFVSSHWNLER